MQDLRALQVKYRLINLLVERRQALHWTQTQLAVRSGIGQAEISKIECGRKSPTLDRYLHAPGDGPGLDEDILATSRPPASVTS